MGIPYKRFKKVAVYRVRRQWLRTRRWWWRADRRYGWWWRLSNGAAVVLVLVGLVIPLAQQLVDAGRYRLSADALKLVGNTDKTLAKQLTYDAQTQTYQFNKDAIKPADSNPLAQLQAQVGTADGKGKNKSLYALDVPADFSKGVTYHDVNSSLSFSLVPEFTASAGKSEQGHLVFPLSGGAQAIYTLKNNGLKEDIVVQKATKDTETFTYTLNLPATLEARVIPDSNGAIGIYSANPNLFGNISYGSDKDRAAVEKAREKSPKTYLVFGLPSPVIKTATATNPAGTSAQFMLHGNQLSVVATGLSGLHIPFTIDPSVVVTSTSDFQTGGSSEDNIDFSTAGQINRAGLTGGSVSGGWTTNGVGLSYSPFRTGVASTVYNGYLYTAGGSYNSTYYNDVKYGTLSSSNGSLTGWASANSFTTGRKGFTILAYNGYMYVMGGNASTGRLGDVQYAPINADGSLGNWTPTTSFTAGYEASLTIAYDGYLYNTIYNDDGTGSIQYAPINADGSVGTWQTSTNNFSNNGGEPLVAYNGYLYVVGAQDQTTGNDLTTVQYAPLGANGTVGTWQTTTSFTTARDGQAAVAYDGYLYLMGGENSSGSPLYNDVQYAPLGANGTVGTWQTTTSFTTARVSAAADVYNGYLYIVGGTGISGGLSDIQYGKLDPAGVTTAYSQASGYGNSTSSQGTQAVAYNGYFYLMGGENGSTPVAAIQAAPINADGSLGTFSGSGYTNFTGVREYFAATAYQGYMYVMGGCSITYGTQCSSTGAYNLNTVYSAPINSDGTIGTWTKQHNTYQAIYGAQAVAYNGYMYIVGGLSNTVFRSYIQYQAIGSGGTLSAAWTLTTASLPTATAYAGVAISGGTLYVAGGCTAGPVTCTTTSNSIFYAPISSSGDITTSFTTNTTTFTNARGDLGMYIWDGYMYITGGYTNTTYYSDTQYAPINANGSVGTWTTSSAGVLPTGRSGFGSTVYNGVLYTAGGFNGSTYYTNIQYAVVNNGGNGTAAGWAYTYNSASSGSFSGGFSGARTGLASVAYEGYLYIIGGYDGSTYYNDVQYAPINSNGTIGTWLYTYNSASSSTFSGGFANKRYNLSAEVYNGYLYIIGGYDGSTYYNDVQYAPINSNGTIGTWLYTYNSASSSTFSGGFATTRESAATAIYNGYLYILGGDSGSTYYNDVQYAPINSNGTIGTWNTTNTFTNLRTSAQAITYNGYLYVLGGNAGSTYYNDVQYAPINSNGTIGTWLYTTSFNDGRAGFAVVAFNGYLYIAGGQDSANKMLSDTQYAAINSNGTLSSWGATSGFSNGRFGLAAVVSNGYLYMLGGGTSGGSNYNDVQFTSLTSIARTGHYSKLIDLGFTANITSISYTTAGGSSYLPGGSNSVTYRAAGNNAVLGSMATAASVNGSGACTGTLTGTRYLWVYVTLDDSYGQGAGGAYPDSAGQNTNLGALTVNYTPTHPAPNIRLRAGQTLQAGVLSPLDTCFP